MQRWDLKSVGVEPHHPEVLHSEGEGRTILISLPAGEALSEHQVHERAWLVVIEGEIEVDGGDTASGGTDGTVTGGPGFLAVFDPNERHEVRASSDARLLLLLAPWPGDGHPRLREG
jgi:redox-sensitive bicupin YhaK (pirin superfamily)